MISSDAINWQQVMKPEVSANLRSVVYAGNQFVIVGMQGLVLTSTDGESWKMHNSNTTRGLYSITYKP